MTHWRRQTGRQAFFFQSDRLVFGTRQGRSCRWWRIRVPLLARGLLGVFDISLCDEVVVGLITCVGEGFVIRQMMIVFGESKHPVFRATSPFSRGTVKSKGVGKLLIHFCADEGTIETVFRTIISLNQLSIYGAVADSCEECKSCHVRTGRPVFGETNWPIVCAHKCDENTFTFDRWSCTRRSIAKVPRTSAQAVTTKSCEQTLYWYKISDNGWCRTVLHDKRHWRILTIHRFSGLSWVHIAKRRKIIWPERLDSREHQNWARIGSHNQLPARLIWSGN